MPRLRNSGWRYEPGAHATIDLLLGPVEGGLTVEQLRVAWEIERERLMEQPRPAGVRPWAFWHFDLREEMPEPSHDQPVRLAELGILTDEEIAALKERAIEARLRVGTDREHCTLGADGEVASSPDRRAVRLWEAIEAAR